MTRRITATINRIRCHTTADVAAPVGTNTVTRLAIDDYLERLHALITIDDNAPSAIDGYSSKSVGARPPEATGARIDADGNVIEPEHDDDILDIIPDPDGWYVLGHIPAISDTSVEAAAINLVEHGNPRDIIHSIRVQAEAEAEKIADALTKLAGALARFDKVRLPLPADTPQCWVARVINALPIDVKWIPGETGKRTKFDGFINVPWPRERLVCRWTYDFVRRWRRLPTRDEMLEYLRTGYVRMNESVEIRTGTSA